MSQRPQTREQFRSPELILSELLKRYARGELASKDEPPRVFHRATVLAVDVVGGRLMNPDGQGTVEHDLESGKVKVAALVGPENPRNSIKARIITDGFDQFVSDDRVRVFWPLLPEHSSVPIKPGEHVLVLFEDETMDHGMWFSKVPGHDDVNFFAGQSSFRPRDRRKLSGLFPSSSGVARPSDPLDTDLAASEVRVRPGRLSSKFGL